jgi:hypothetical protein
MSARSLAYHLNRTAEIANEFVLKDLEEFQVGIGEQERTSGLRASNVLREDASFWK